MPGASQSRCATRSCRHDRSELRSTRQRGVQQQGPERLGLEQLTTPESALPIWGLSWFLNSYVAGLPAEVAARFRKFTVEQLMESPEEYLEDDIVRELRMSTNIELACGCILVGTRRPD